MKKIFKKDKAKKEEKKHSLDNQKKLGINERVIFVEPYMSWFWKYTKDHNLMGKDEDYEEELKSI